MVLKEKLNEIDAMVSKGQMIDAVKLFFTEDAVTSDTGGIKTSTRDQMVEKMEAFVGAIAEVKSIEHHYSIITENVSASEFTFNFKMNDDTEILWHEIIRRVWTEDGKISQEQYFKS